MAQIKFNYHFDGDLIFNDGTDFLGLNFEIDSNEMDDIKNAVLQKFDIAIQDHNIKYEKNNLRDVLVEQINDAFDFLDEDKKQELYNDGQFELTRNSNWELSIDVTLDEPQPKSKNTKKNKKRPK